MILRSLRDPNRQAVQQVAASTGFARIASDLAGFADGGLTASTDLIERDGKRPFGNCASAMSPGISDVPRI